MGEKKMEILTGDVMCVKGASLYLGVSERKLRSLVATNEVPYFKIGSSLRFLKEEVDKWCKRRTINVG